MGLSCRNWAPDSEYNATWLITFIRLAAKDCIGTSVKIYMNTSGYDITTELIVGTAFEFVVAHYGLVLQRQDSGPAICLQAETVCPIPKTTRDM